MLINMYMPEANSTSCPTDCDISARPSTTNYKSKSVMALRNQDSGITLFLASK